MEKFLFYGDSTSSMTCIPARRLSEIQRFNETTIFILHELPFSSTVGSDSQYVATVNISGEPDKVINTITKAINSGKDPFIVVSDGVSGVGLHSNMTTVGALPAIS